MDNYQIECRRFSYEIVSAILVRVSSLFTPPLSDGLDMEQYAHKLSEKAIFLTCCEAEKMVGFIAYYLNEQVKEFYITLICVDSAYQTNGIGSQMLDKLIRIARQSRISCETIALEVNKQNSKAYSFYKKHGFVEQEDRGTKILMKKNL